MIMWSKSHHGTGVVTHSVSVLFSYG